MQAAGAAQSWLELRQRLTDQRTPWELELEVARRFLSNIALGMGEHSWLSRNNRLVFSGREDFPAHYRTHPLDEIFAMQRSQGAAHYDNLLAGVQRGNTSSDWVIWSGKTGREFTFWSSATINGDIWTFGLSVPEASILSSPLLRQELQRAKNTAIAGSMLTLTLLGVLLFSEISSHRHIVDLRREISDRTTVETDLRKSENRYRRLFSHSKAMQLIIESKTGRIIDANEAAARFYGYPIEFMQAMSLSDLNAMPAEQLKEQITSAKSAERDHYLFQHRLSNGELRDVEMYTTGVRLHGNNLLYAIIHDITERIRMEEEIKHLGNHDVLTGLPNRSLLDDRLEMACLQADRHGHRVAVLFIDLDGFKPINDSLGHIAGDELLKLVTQRLHICIRGIDTVARFGGDEFVVVSAEIHNHTAAVTVAEKILTTLAHPYTIGNHEVQISASIGIAVYPINTKTPAGLLIEADKAMYVAKEGGKNRFHLSRQRPSGSGISGSS
ncbi:MAG: hypothetical protein B0D96_12280 [Candidatus Sedimenticola endophacoides]|uniref:GGDEF domain-containing protein n=1 Tax=Candidatus Sedimenticola endophacoides TaxID=2548426 RepID=A0A657Q1S6_9GAMM|nr:MAG: hypothetical protein B0D94_08410 [Candidatus Sedimenticola endophacoides]OQX33086.1 MAG: hypothetical protein B0D96_12280 [Candidatus Sedimenticola endophacoides]OQX33401.1 MAG: hypothetical protein B0D84_04680 [Candidatus Sedimenticola endophacoides]OQX42533.1 MAG: hypothetical protein B0D89_01085 [Candidatus Sedimenticola endophacoides]OQX45352.1 MAG: hypothetical protein B0D88_00555 [Candidatus Sedimenticola endophacoides]